VIVVRHVDIVDDDVKLIGFNDNEDENKKDNKIDEDEEMWEDTVDKIDLENNNHNANDLNNEQRKSKRQIKAPVRFDEEFGYYCITVNIIACALSDLTYDTIFNSTKYAQLQRVKPYIPVHSISNNHIDDSSNVESNEMEAEQHDDVDKNEILLIGFARDPFRYSIPEKDYLRGVRCCKMHDKCYENIYCRSSQYTSNLTTGHATEVILSAQSRIINQTTISSMAAHPDCVTVTAGLPCASRSTAAQDQELYVERHL
ncbi:hypothetical protein ACJJTC_015310, partial [Scirpophaga incertulas]